MPCLKKLEITKCWQLEYYPLGLNFVKTLKQLEFFDMPYDFRREAAHFGWVSQILRLPHNFTSIVKHSDSPVDTSSISKVYEQLTRGIFLENKTKKFLVKKQRGSYVNSFMFYASSLYILTSDIHSGKLSMKDCPAFELREVIESEEGVMVAKLKSSASSGYYGVVGKFDFGNLSVKVAYVIYWFVMFEKSVIPDELSGFVICEKKFSEMSRKFSDMNLRTKLRFIDEVGRNESLISTQPNEWIRIPGGEIETDGTTGELYVSLTLGEGMNNFDLVIKGFIIQPKP